MADCPVCGVHLDSVYGYCPTCGMSLDWYRWRLQGGVLAIVGAALLVAGEILNLLTNDATLLMVLAAGSGSSLIIGIPYYLYYSYRINSLKVSWTRRKVPIP